jgi:hypothetical protein
MLAWLNYLEILKLWNKIKAKVRFKIKRKFLSLISKAGILFD